MKGYCYALFFAVLFFATTPLPVSNDFIYYSSEAGSQGRDIYKLSLKGRQAMKITKNNGRGHYPHHIHPKLSPDGKTIVFQSDPDGHDRYSIWTMNTDGSNLKRITQKEGMYPNWSPDGQTIIFSGRREGVWEILRVPAKGGPEINLTQNKAKGKRPGWGAVCSYHPNGESIVFAYIREKTLHQMDLSSQQTTQLGTKGVAYSHPIFSRDGSHIAVNQKITNQYDLVLLSENGENPEVIAKGVISYSSPAWSSDGQELLFTGMVNGNQELFKVNRTTREEVQITKNSDFDAMPTW